MTTCGYGVPGMWLAQTGMQCKYKIHTGCQIFSEYTQTISLIVLSLLHVKLPFWNLWDKLKEVLKLILLVSFYSL